MASAPDLCDDPYRNAIERLPLSLRLSYALTRMWAALTRRHQELVPLIFALQWTRDNSSIRTLAAPSKALVDALCEQIQLIAREIERRGG